MRPRRERLAFLLRGRVLPHVVPMPSKRKIVVQRVDQQVKQLCTPDVSTADLCHRTP